MCGLATLVPMARWRQFVLLVSACLLAWLLMQAVHELGHAAAAWWTGAKVTAVVLHPLAISRTDVDPNPQPLVVAWGGPLIGSIIPVAIWGLAEALRLHLAWLARCFAGFCLLANGLYIGVGSFAGIGDSGALRGSGAALWTRWLFGAIAAPAGLDLWHGQGRHFGLGAASLPINPRVAYGCVLALLATAVLEILAS